MQMEALILWELEFMKTKIQEAIKDLNLQNFSVGNDLVHLPDFKLSFNELFRSKIYTTNEISYCEAFDNPILRYASTWAAKEAVYKAIKQLNDRPISFKKIEIIRDKIAGIPRVYIPEDYLNTEISLSITHDGDYIFAIAIAKRKYD